MTTTTPAKRAAKKTAAPPRSRAKAAAAPTPSPAAVDEPIGADGLLDLDAIAHEATGERYQFWAGKRLWYLRSPEELDWLENSVASRASASEDLRPVLKLLLGEQYEDFIELKITLGQVGVLTREWQKHHGITVPESSASPES